MLPVALGADLGQINPADGRIPTTHAIEESRPRGRIQDAGTGPLPDVSLDRALRSADLFRDRRQCGAGFAPVILGVEAVDDEDVARDPRGERRA
jgi:hypothetical protein